MERSTTLFSIGIHNILIETKPDGDCFYHAVSDQMNHIISSNTLRSLVSAKLRKEDVMIHNALHETNLSLEELKTLVKKPGLVWADDIYIQALCRVFPNIQLLIVDEDLKTISLHGNKNIIVKPFVIMLKNSHYSGIKLNKLLPNSLLTSLQKKTVVELNTFDSKFMIILLFMCAYYYYVSKLYYPLVKTHFDDYTSGRKD